MHRTTQYAIDVVEGNIVAGEYVKLACERHLNDLEKSKLAPYVYRFDEEKANELIEFSETLIIGEGEEKQQLSLEPFQAFIFGSLHGWVHKSTGYRRFRSSYVQVGRQQGKSIMNGILGTFYGNFDGYNYGQIYCTATKMDQAKIVLKEMIKFIRSDDDLEELFKIKEYESTIECLITNSEIRALGRDTKSIDGFRPLLGIIDEYHAHPDNQMYKQLEGGTGNLKESLISVITTAGFDLGSPCYELYEYCCNLLKGVFENETQFVYIAQLDKDDDIWDPQNWVKANPLTCKTQEGIDRMVDIAAKAKQMGGNELRDFMTKRLNIWIQFTDDDFIKMEHWKACESDKTLEDFKGKTCIAGLDLSSGGDLTSLALVFPYEEEHKKYFVHSHSFIPKNRVQEHIEMDAAPYDIWINEGLLTVTETLGGIKTDYKYIISYLERLIDEYDLNIRVVCYDPHNASTFLYDIESLGLDSLEVKQTARALNDATVDFRLEVEAGNVEYNKNNKLLTWSVANAKLTSNSFGEIKVSKNMQQKRIDPVDAVIDAWTVAMTQDTEINLTEVTNDFLDMMGW